MNCWLTESMSAMGWGLDLTGQQGQKREARKPMLAHIIAGNVGERSSEMLLGALFANRPCFCGQQRRNRAPAPGPAQVQTVKVRDLAVAPVADGRRLEQRRGLALADARKEMTEPCGKFRRVGL